MKFYNTIIIPQAKVEDKTEEDVHVATKSYVDTLIGDIQTVLSNINNLIGNNE